MGGAPNEPTEGAASAAGSISIQQVVALLQQYLAANVGAGLGNPAQLLVLPQAVQPPTPAVQIVDPTPATLPGPSSSSIPVTSSITVGPTVQATPSSSSAVPQSSADFDIGSDEESDDAKAQARFAREAERTPKRSVRDAEVLDNKIDRMMEELEQQRPEVSAVRTAARVILF